MTKYIYIFLFIIIWNVPTVASNHFSVEDERLDSLYVRLSLEDKVRSVFILPTVYPSSSHDSMAHWMNIEKLLGIEGEHLPMLSDVMIRSAFLRGSNAELQKQFLNVLLKKKGDGVYFPMRSPYSLLFQDESHKPADFYLEPIGRLIVPYLNQDSTIQRFQTNLYNLPKNVLSEHSQLSIESLPLKDNEGYVKGVDWKGVQKLMKEYEEPSLEMLLAHGGLIYTDDYEKDYDLLIRIFENKILPIEILEKSCKKRLLMNELLMRKPTCNSYFSSNESVHSLIRNLYKKGAVLLQNIDIIPVNKLVNRKIASIHIGVKEKSVFHETLSRYSSIKHFNFEKVPNSDQLSKISKETKDYNTIIVGVDGDWFEEDLNSSLYSFLHQISSKADLILVHFGSGNRLESLPNEHPFKAILLSFDTNEVAQEIAAQIIFGGIGAQGALAKNINEQFSFGKGELTQKCRLGFAPLYEAAIKDTLKLIDQVVYKAIRERAAPGCQVLVAKGGDVIYNKAFGYHTYAKRRHVQSTDLYDIASVTKIVSSIPSVMKMFDEGKIKLENTLSTVLPRLKGSNKSGLRLDDIMIHQAGLQSWIPFYMRAIDKEKLNDKDIYNRKYSSQYNIKVDKKMYMNKAVRYKSTVFKHGRSEMFNIQVSGDLYMNRMFVDSMLMGLDTSEVKENPEYGYSDLGYYYLKEIIETKYKTTQDNFVENTFYRALGAERLMYKPLRKFSKKEIVPTENDISFRKELIHGFVHDPGAAMLGGVGGHAGVFASAEDLAKMLQMYLFDGSYGGEKYIDSTTIKTFSSIVKEGNRRGLGFDKPVLDPDISGPTCKEVSPSSFGHSGFTGTLVWMDPEYELLYIFLSNRIHPNQYNKKLISEDVRTNIQSAIYRALPEYWENKKRNNKKD